MQEHPKNEETSVQVKEEMDPPKSDEKDQANPSKSAEQRHSKTDPMCAYVNNCISTHTHTYTEEFCS